MQLRLRSGYELAVQGQALENLSIIARQLFGGDDKNNKAGGSEDRPQAVQSWNELVSAFSALGGKVG